jgi:glycosyltransferase involved in cell wall biosynthesis
MSATSEAAARAIAAEARARPTLSVVAIGVSTARVCGVHDHAAALAAALADERISCSLHWLARGEPVEGGDSSSIGSWTRSITRELDRERPDAVLLHYSVFAFSARGVPLHVPPLLARLRAVGVPVVTVLHEYAHPWRGGARGLTWALTQRAILSSVMRASAGLVVTASFRVDWLQSRPWLPRRPIALAPVFSTLPAPRPGVAPAGSGGRIGLFGYGHDGAAMETVLDAIGLLERDETAVELILLGAPGASSTAGAAWRAASRERGLANPPAFSGVLPAQELSDAIAACDVLLSAEPAGPTSRKTTLAASLASGRPVVALDGRRRWGELVRAQAALVVEPTASALARALAGLVGDAAAREQLGRRGRAFAERSMSVAGSARAVAKLLRETAPGRVP